MLKWTGHLVLTVVVLGLVATSGVLNLHPIAEVSDGNNVEVSLWGSQLEANGYLCLREKEALDEPDTFLDDSPQWRLRADLAGLRDLRVAGAPERAEGSGQEDQGLEVEGEIGGNLGLEAPLQPEGGEGRMEGCETRQASRYFCVGDSTGRYCPVSEGGNATSSGTSVHIGTVACRRNETDLHRCFTLEGFDQTWCCEDTGGPAIEVDGYMDFWARDLDEALRLLPTTPTVCVRWVN